MTDDFTPNEIHHEDSPILDDFSSPARKSRRLRTLVALLSPLCVGVCLELYFGDYKSVSDTGGRIGWIFGYALGEFIGVITLPVIVCGIIYLIRKSFPHNTFAIMTYVILAFITIGLLAARH